MIGGGGAERPRLPFRASALSVYYLATPLFAALDLAGAPPVRAAGLDGAGRLAWYAGAFCIGLAMSARPRWAPLLAMLESAANLTVLMAAVLVPVWSLSETLDGSVAEALPGRVLNLALGGGVLVYAFYRAQAELSGRRGERGA